ncbi:response regulator [Taibaiella soli]|uniref:Response regulator n=1 Tax=Taibaiella soli TaxID=1649169 RepID=A0A2W2AK71_9BACT|nr:response regulator [Taibaiella soli]PZF72650.1 response regulator [Taibaiella soli]
METCTRLMLINDDAMFNYSHKKTLAEYRYTLQVEEFTNAREALMFVREAVFPGPCVILLDINMPAMVGWTFLEELERINDPAMSKFKVVMLSSSVSSSDVMKASQYKNVCGYLINPLNIEMLNDILLRNGILLARELKRNG